MATSALLLTFCFLAASVAAQESDVFAGSENSGGGEGPSFTYGGNSVGGTSVQSGTVETSSSGLSPLSVLLMIILGIAVVTLVPWCILPKGALATRKMDGQKRRGWLHCLFFLLIIASFTISVLVTRSCKFLLLGLANDERENRFGLGLFRLQDENHICGPYSDDYKQDQFDGYIQFARFFSVVNAILTGLAKCLWMTWRICYPNARAMWKCIRLCLYLSFWSACLVFFLYGHDECHNTEGYNCVAGSGGILAIVNLLLLVALSVLGFSGHVLTPQSVIHKTDETVQQPPEEPTVPSQ